jgi:hypothetical protein
MQRNSASRRWLWLALGGVIAFAFTFVAAPASAAPTNKLEAADFESNPWASFKLLEPQNNNWYRYCDGSGHASRCFVEFNGGRSDAVSLYQDVAMPTTETTSLVAGAVVRCPKGQAGCRAVLAVWGDPGDPHQETQSLRCELPADGRWYHLRLDGSDNTVANGDPTFTRSHQIVRWELYNRTPRSNLDVDDAFLSADSPDRVPFAEENQNDRVCVTDEESNPVPQQRGESTPNSWKDGAYLDNNSGVTMVAAGEQEPWDGPCRLWNSKGGSSVNWDESHSNHCRWTTVDSGSSRGPRKNVDFFTVLDGSYRVRFGGGKWKTFHQGEWTKIRNDEYADCTRGTDGPDCTVHNIFLSALQPSIIA